MLFLPNVRMLLNGLDSKLHLVDLSRPEVYMNHTKQADLGTSKAGGSEP